MGAVQSLSGSQELIMKFFLALLFVGLAFAEPDSEPKAAAEAEADPEAWYSSYYGGYPGYYGHRYYGYGGWGRPYYGYRHYGYGLWGRKKRDAEADPAVLASSSAVKAPQVYHHPYVYGYPYAGVHHPVAAPVTYTHPVAPAVYHHPVTTIILMPMAFHMSMSSQQKRKKSQKERNVMLRVIQRLKLIPKLGTTTIMDMVDMDTDTMDTDMVDTMDIPMEDTDTTGVKK